MRKNIAFVIALAALAGTAVAGDASDPKAASPAGPTFGAVDGNQDGQISRQEASQVPGLKESFDAVDTDGDGGLSLKEYTAAMKGSEQS